MTKHQMAQKIQRLERRIKDLEIELQCATDRILPVDVGAERLRPPKHQLLSTTGPQPSWTPGWGPGGSPGWIEAIHWEQGQ